MLEGLGFKGLGFRVYELRVLLACFFALCATLGLLRIEGYRNSRNRWERFR